jgi:hypothetical protein
MKHMLRDDSKNVSCLIDCFKNCKNIFIFLNFYYNTGEALATDGRVLRLSIDKPAMEIAGLSFGAYVLE